EWVSKVMINLDGPANAKAQLRANRMKCERSVQPQIARQLQRSLDDLRRDVRSEAPRDARNQHRRRDEQGLGEYGPGKPASNKPDDGTAKEPLTHLSFEYVVGQSGEIGVTKDEEEYRGSATHDGRQTARSHAIFRDQIASVQGREDRD